MRRWFLILFVIALVIVGIELFRPSPPFPDPWSAGVTAGAVAATPGQTAE